MLIIYLWKLTLFVWYNYATNAITFYCNASNILPRNSEEHDIANKEYRRISCWKVYKSCPHECNE